MERINPIRHGFSMKPIREGHGHLCFEKPIAETEEAFRNLMRHFNYETIHINSIPASYSITDNYKTVYCKAKLAPRVFASAGFEYYLAARDK